MGITTSPGKFSVNSPISLSFFRVCFPCVQHGRLSCRCINLSLATCVPPCKVQFDDVAAAARGTGGRRAAISAGRRGGAKGAGKELHSPAKVQPCVPSRQPNCIEVHELFPASFVPPRWPTRYSRPKPTCFQMRTFHQGPISRETMHSLRYGFFCANL